MKHFLILAMLALASVAGASPPNPPAQEQNKPALHVEAGCGQACELQVQVQQIQSGTQLFQLLSAGELLSVLQVQAPAQVQEISGQAHSGLPPSVAVQGASFALRRTGYAKFGVGDSQPSPTWRAINTLHDQRLTSERPQTRHLNLSTILNC